MSAALSKNTPKSYLHLGIMLAIMFIFRLPVPPEGLTAEGMAVIGIFFAVLYGWLFLDIVWPSLLRLVALGLAINEPMTEVICMVASIINAAGIAEWMARKIISLPIVRGRPYMLILMLAAAMSVLATMLTMTAAVVVGFPLIKEVCKQYGYKPGDTFPVMLFVAMFYIADVAFMILPSRLCPPWSSAYTPSSATGTSSTTPPMSAFAPSSLFWPFCSCCFCSASFSGRMFPEL